MTPGEIINIKNEIRDLGIVVGDIEKVIAGLKIDKQLVLHANAVIAPGIGCRVTYDSKGLILKTEDLRIEDIPDLPVEKITGLKKILDDKVDGSILDNLKASNITADREKIKPGTGIKINYDENGFVVSSVDSLSIFDIPDLPFGKIIGLTDKLAMIESQMNEITHDEVNPYSITPGTFTKITYGADGRVISGSKLSMDDIPIDFITRMNVIESRIPVLASQQTVDALSKDVAGKLEANKQITPGVFTKLSIDEKGLVISGDILTIKDLPEIQIKDITNLASMLRNKAEQSDLIELTNTVSSMMSNNGSVELASIRNELSSKASDDNLKDLGNKVDNIQNLLTVLTDKLPSEFIITQLQDIQDKLSTLTGRVTTLENQLKAPSQS